MLYVKASGKELFVLKALLQSFAQGTGLKVNFHKSCLIPINVSEDKAEMLAGVFGYRTGSMPFTYLGLPLGTTKPRVIDFAPLVDRIERRLSANSAFLSNGDRLTLVNSVFSSLPTYYMCTLQLPKSVIENIDRARRHCLWRGGDINSNKKSLVAWDKVCKPKVKWGLGVINLSIQNQALLLKFLDKFYNRRQVPWVSLIWSSYYENKVPHLAPIKGSFWWKDICKLMDIYRGISRCILGNGSSCSFWDDIWSDGPPLSLHMPRLHSFAINKNVSVQSFLPVSVEEQFQLPISQQTYDELLSRSDTITEIDLFGDNDSWAYIWGNLKYASQKYYALNFRAMQPPQCFVWL